MALSNRAAAALLFVGSFAAYNSNGREIASFDSQPTKLAARELLVHHTLALNYAVGAAPELITRQGFVLARDGRYRSAYSPVPALLSAAIAWPAWRLGIVDLQAPRAPALVAAVSASLLTSIAVVFAFLCARQRLSLRRAMLLAIGFGLGTGLWSTASQTLWQHETAILGLSMAVYAFAAPHAVPSTRAAVVMGLGLGLAGTARPQTAVAIAVLLVGVVVRGGWRRGVVTTAIVGAFAAPLMIANLRWFGSILGAAPGLEALHETVHFTGPGSFHLQFNGLAGLLVAPSRGLFIFSPVTLLSILGVRAAATEGWATPLRWCALAAVAQYCLYGSYAAWWGGHTYGPRYMLDVLPLLVPLSAHGLTLVRGVTAKAIACAALSWSIGVAALGAFCYPNDRWNTEPMTVDRYHERLWDWSDTQILRCWHAGPSPQNFNLLARASFRRDVR